MKVIDLKGVWKYKTDEDDCGVGREYYKSMVVDGDFNVPGTTCSNMIGRKQEYYDVITKENVRAPREKYEYIAPLWLTREIEIPEDFAGKCIRLFIERANMASELWIDGEKAARQIIELSAPHIYNISGIKPGKHTLTLRLDNRNLLNIGDMASGYSVDTQGYWNGIIGRIEIQCEEMIHLENIQVYPDETGINIKLTQTSDVYSPMNKKNGVIEINVTTPDGENSEKKVFNTVIQNSKQVASFRYDIKNPQYWDEFTPSLYTLNVRFMCEGSSDEKHIKFGMRTIKTEDKEILLNDNPIALRGTIDCAQYPITGHPPMDKEPWLRNMKIIKSYGLNHIRFHAWCPPECAFEAADELGIYLLVEMPLWLNRDVCPLEFGEDAIHRFYYHIEAETISKTYGNHPSFVMFSNGNENMGDFELLEDITTHIKAYDNRRIYTLTSNFDHPVRPCEDYFSAMTAAGHRVRIQDIHDDTAMNTAYDYSEAVDDTELPIVSFEVGQYCVYPDVDIIDKYSGNMLPVNFDVIKKFMIEKGVYERRHDYLKASGALALLLYKEDIECALRTKKFGGFELLSMCDYTGQNTATVGMLDVMYNSKGIVSPEKFRHFCCEVVPLFKAKRIFKSGEIIEAELDLYDYGKNKINKPVYRVTVSDGDKIIFKTETTDKKVFIHTDKIDRSAMLKVTVSVNEYENSWTVFVYDDCDSESDARIISDKKELIDIIENGGKAVLTPKNIKSTIKCEFVPVFWSPVLFPTQRLCGAMIDENHHVFDYFPTDKYLDYQWKTPFDKAVAIDISDFDGLNVIYENVPNFADNTKSSPLFELKVGKANLLFCGFDLDEQDLSSRALRKSIFEYVNSDLFNPKYETVPEKLLSLFTL